MNLQTEKLYIIQQLININDVNIVQNIKDLLSKSYKDKIQAMTLEKFFAKIDESEQAYINDDVISNQELKNEIKSWRKEK